MKIVFFGPPAVGKGTHAGLISKHYGIPKISTGEIFRDEIKAGTKLGREADKYIKKGHLVPDNIVIQILKNKLASEECRKGFILDGFPRTLVQAKELDKIENIQLVVNMVASRDTLMARMTNRWTCSRCGAIYNTLFAKPKKPGICDVCGGKLYQRDDQRPDVVSERLEVYEKQTKPVIKYYREKGILIDVDAEGEKDDVHKRILAAVEEYFKGKQ